LNYILTWLVLIRSIVLTVFIILVLYRGIIQRNASKLLVASAFVTMVASGIATLINTFQPAILNRFVTVITQEVSEEIVPEIFFVVALIIVKPKFEKQLTMVYWALVLSLIPLYPVLINYVNITAPLFGLSDIVLYSYLYYWTRTMRLLAVGSSVGIFALAGILDELGLSFYSDVLVLVGAVAIFCAFFLKITLSGQRQITVVAVEKKSSAERSVVLLSNDQARKKREEVENRLRRFWW
jgi:hypothetical protein